MSKFNTMTEQEMRDLKVPTFNTVAELTEYISDLRDKQHDYGTAVYAMSMAAVATFNYMASFLGVTGFQASCADLDILRRTRSLKAPFMIVNLDKALYPQYDILGDVAKFISNHDDWIYEMAYKKLEEENEQKEKCPNYFPASEKVVAHWCNIIKTRDKL